MYQALYTPDWIKKKLCRIKGINHQQCDTMEFWGGSTDMLGTEFRLLIFNFHFRKVFVVTMKPCCVISV